MVGGRWAAWAAALCIAMATVYVAFEMWSSADPRRAEDAVAVYLPARALYLGADPTSRAALDELLRRESTSGVATGVLSTLYPPPLAVALARQAAGGWAPFLAIWRAIVLIGLLIGSATLGGVAARGRSAPLGAALAAALAIGHPLTRHALELGQANLLLAGLFCAAIAAAAVDAGALVAVLAVAGIGVKLVPGIVLWPLLAARRWRALGVATAVGLAVAFGTFAFIPLDRVVANLLDTVRFQQGVVPAWVSPEENRWSTLLGVFRFGPLGLISLALAGVCSWSGRDRPTILAASIALMTAWLGTASAAVGVFYGLFLVPPAMFVALWPLEAGAPRAAWLAPLVAAVPYVLLRSPDGDVEAALEMVFVGLIVWGATIARLAYASRYVLTRRSVGIVVSCTVLALGYTIAIGAFPPPAPTGAPVPTPQQGPHVGPR